MGELAATVCSKYWKPQTDRQTLSKIKQVFESLASGKWQASLAKCFYVMLMMFCHINNTI
jgi:hypothetical protein